MTQKERILAQLEAMKCEDQLGQISRQVLTRLIESDFRIDLAGTETDESGSLFGYVIYKPAMLDKFSGSPFDGILVFRIETSDTVTAPYLGVKLDSLEIFNEDEKQLCLDNIEQALLG